MKYNDILTPGLFLWEKDLNSVYTAANRACNELFGLKNNNTMVGMTDYDIPCKLSEFADTFQRCDQEVLCLQKPLKLLEIHPCVEDTWKVMMTAKNVLYGSNGEIVGTSAYCVDLTDILNDIARVLSKNSTSYQKNQAFSQGCYILGQSEIDMKLSPRQSECLFFLMRGRTTKQIANLLNLSPRTIEEYIDYIKMKFGCNTKSELITAAIEQGFMNIIPETLFNARLVSMLSCC